MSVLSVRQAAAGPRGGYGSESGRTRQRNQLMPFQIFQWTNICSFFVAKYDEAFCFFQSIRKRSPIRVGINFKPSIRIRIAFFSVHKITCGRGIVLRSSTDFASERVRNSRSFSGQSPLGSVHRIGQSRQRWCIMSQSGQQSGGACHPHACDPPFESVAVFRSGRHQLRRN